ncbi:MAG: hypothetical protein L6R38_007734 [Xanthoria sp. 2 TBL-2021]|nr:MAG: hypothetical protein L6R38_007734 [Xanthoria sp. 2 TBL-2021]
MFFLPFTASFIVPLAILTLPSTFAHPVVTTIQAALNSQHPDDYKYDIRLCNDTQRASLNKAIDSALEVALKTWHDASTRTPSYEAFFKTHNHPVLDTLSKVASYEAVPARGVEIFWACVTPKTKTYFPRAGIDMFKACDSGEINGYAIVDSFILVCPQIFDATDPAPQAENCPSISDNTFSADVELPIYSSDIVLQALVDYSLPTQAERYHVNTLDEMVGLDSHSSYLSPQSYQIYSIMTKNNCTQAPNIRKSPWDPALITDNTTMPISESLPTGAPPDADGKEVPNINP